jgi:dsDNA-specific endonuclease/ATPase MutS2
VPRAALHLKLADEQISQARQMIQNGDNERADYMTLRAYNDAELALAIAREETARKRAEQLESKASNGSNQNPPTNNNPSSAAKP